MGEWSWIFSAGMFVLALAGQYGTWMMFRAKAERTAEDVKAATAKAENAEAALAAFKTEVARDYASAKMVEQVEARVVGAIDRLGDRLDNIVELVLANGRPATRSAPRKRAANP